MTTAEDLLRVTGRPVLDLLVSGVCTCDACRRFDSIAWAREFEREVRPVESLWRPADAAEVQS